ncbi:hypothetical protein CERSUDRAFT_87642 [Gelatoporia subvermispora B]|uniref:L-type lectin-like domain-containing protein n=1 Tax=Ceriporiopsis subvermispora (strain B) TaxID=914234 RepID=M2PBL2_CERS8|nr:hypothetical protein CERSUDRAFT_87642 [Gelatoporia subvermispora B]
MQLLGGLLLCLGLLPWGILGASDDKTKLANRTIERTISLRTHSIYAPYIDQDLQNRWWDFGADAYVNTNKHVRLTRNKPSQMGWLWTRLPVTASNFVVEVEFKIGGDSSHLYGDGLAIWLTKGRAEPGPVFGSPDNFEGLGVFLDTYANSRHAYSFPRIVGMSGDGKTPYDLAHDGDANSIGACSANYRRTNVATKLKITYLKDAYLNVKIQYKAWDDWTECFTVPGFVLPNAPYLGFSAMTGDVADNHDIISVTTYSAILSNPDAQRDKIGARVSPKASAATSWTWPVLKLFFGVGVIAGLLYAYKTYVLTQASGRRFDDFVTGGKKMAGFGGGLYGNSKRF